MKVAERDTNRTAEVHICVEGKLQPLKEYGQYVDPTDGAICCYVAVEEEDKIKFDGRFTGTTHIVAYDALVDGICRKANSYVSQSVKNQKNRKLDFDTFLYKTPNGVIDTKMVVASYPGQADLDKTAPETVGTLELRLSITRQFGVEHDIDETKKYDKADADASTQTASYKDVPPQFHMIFEENSPTLEGLSGSREKGKMNKKRPGTQPWAIFRFHYRTEDSILEKKMPLTFEHANKALLKEMHHILELTPVPMLLEGSKPANKHDGENSVRTVSPAPSDTPSAHTTGFKKPQAKKTRESLSSPKAFGKQSTTSASPCPITDADAATTNTSTTPTPDESTSGGIDIPRSVLQAQETGDSIISSTLPAGSDVDVRGKKSFKIASSAPHKLDTTSPTGPNDVTYKASIIPTVPEPTHEPNAVETTTPFKRAPDDVLTPPPDIKRIRTDAPLRSPSSVSPGPRSPSVGMQLAEKRKKLETTRKQRAELAEKSSHLEERLTPHKQRMAAELERAEQELAEEEAMKAEEEEEYKAKQMLLVEYEGGDSAF